MSFFYSMAKDLKESVFEYNVEKLKQKGLKMVYLEVSSDKFIKENPSIESMAMRACDRFNLSINKARPFISKDFIGLCLDPKNPFTKTVKVYRDGKSNREAADRLNDIL